MPQLLTTDPHFTALLTDLPATEAMTATHGTYEAAADRLRLLEREDLTLELQIDELTSQLVDASGSAFTDLRNRRAELLYRRQTLPQDLATAREAHRVATVAWLDAVGHAAHAAWHQAHQEVRANRVAVARMAQRLAYLPASHKERKALLATSQAATAAQRERETRRNRMMRLRDLCDLERRQLLPRVHSLSPLQDLTEHTRLTVRYTFDGTGGQKVTVPPAGSTELLGHRVTFADAN